MGTWNRNLVFFFQQYRKTKSELVFGVALVEVLQTYFKCPEDVDLICDKIGAEVGE